MKKINIAIAVIIFVLFSVAFFLRHAHNKFVDEAHLVHVARDRVETELQRRHDVDTRSRDVVKQYMDIEGKIFDRLIELNRLIQTDANEAGQHEMKMELSELIVKLDILKEAYPELKSEDPYVYLMETVQNSGRRVTRERLRFNEKAYGFNMMLHIFPYRTLAWLFGYDREPFFKALKGAERAPSLETLLNHKFSDET